MADLAATGVCRKRAASVRHCFPVVFANEAHQARNAHDSSLRPTGALGEGRRWAGRAWELELLNRDLGRVMDVEQAAGDV